MKGLTRQQTEDADQKTYCSTNYINIDDLPTCMVNSCKMSCQGSARTIQEKIPPAGSDTKQCHVCEREQGTGHSLQSAPLGQGDSCRETQAKPGPLPVQRDCVPHCHDSQEEQALSMGHTCCARRESLRKQSSIMICSCTAQSLRLRGHNTEPTKHTSRPMNRYQGHAIPPAYGLCHIYTAASIVGSVLVHLGTSSKLQHVSGHTNFVWPVLQQSWFAPEAHW
eukprot:1091577-Rhodomonas_salina.1